MDVGKMFSFDGRIGRGAFWLLTIITVIIPLLLFLINPVVGIIGYIAMIWISLATSAKRWHDRGKSGWWSLIALIPLIGAIWALVETGFLAGQPVENSYGLPDSGSPFGGPRVATQPV